MTRIHALTDPQCRQVVLHLTPGQDAGISAAPDVLAKAPPMRMLIADKGYDGDAIRAVIAVGTVIADRPPHRSTQAAFPHAAPTSGV